MPLKRKNRKKKETGSKGVEVSPPASREDESTIEPVAKRSKVLSIPRTCSKFFTPNVRHFIGMRQKQSKLDDF